MFPKQITANTLLALTNASVIVLDEDRALVRKSQQYGYRITRIPRQAIAGVAVAATDALQELTFTLARDGAEAERRLKLEAKTARAVARAVGRTQELGAHDRHENTVAVVTGGTQGVGTGDLPAAGRRRCSLPGHLRPQRRSAANWRRPSWSGSAPSVALCRQTWPSADDCVRVVETALDAFGRVNALVNSAATCRRGGLLDTDLALWEEIMAVNLRAPFLTMQRTVRALKEAGEPGSIVNILSINVLCGQTFLTPYSASKGGLATLTKNVANAFARDRIRCNGILVGWTGYAGRRSHSAAFSRRRQRLGRASRPEAADGPVDRS